MGRSASRLAISAEIRSLIVYEHENSDLSYDLAWFRHESTCSSRARSSLWGSVWDSN